MSAAPRFIGSARQAPQQPPRRQGHANAAGKKHDSTPRAGPALVQTQPRISQSLTDTSTPHIWRMLLPTPPIMCHRSHHHESLSHSPVHVAGKSLAAVRRMTRNAAEPVPCLSQCGHEMQSLITAGITAAAATAPCHGTPPPPPGPSPQASTRERRDRSKHAPPRPAVHTLTGDGLRSTAVQVAAARSAGRNVIELQRTCRSSIAQPSAARPCGSCGRRHRTAVAEAEDHAGGAWARSRLGADASRADGLQGHTPRCQHGERHLPAAHACAVVSGHRTMRAPAKQHRAVAAAQRQGTGRALTCSQQKRAISPIPSCSMWHKLVSAAVLDVEVAAGDTYLHGAHELHGHGRRQCMVHGGSPTEPPALTYAFAHPHKHRG